MAIKMIVCDMDGTLLTSENEIQPKTYAKLIELQKKGIIIVLASGRSYIRLLPDAKKLLLDKYNGFLIDVNGSSIYNVTESQRKRIGKLEKDNIEEINDFFNIFNVELQYSQDDTTYTYLTDSIYKLKKKIRGEMRLPEDYPWMGGMYGWLADFRDGYPNQYMIRDLDKAPEHCNKISVVQEPFYMEFVRKAAFNSTIAEKYEFVSSDYRKLEVTKKGINKGNALKLLMKRLNVENNEVIIFGDSENDLSMFTDKKYSVAMANALPKAKDLTRFSTDSNDQEGIYKMLVKFEENNIL